jgi:hypothetical protein
LVDLGRDDVTKVNSRSGMTRHTTFEHYSLGRHVNLVRSPPPKSGEHEHEAWSNEYQGE